MKPTDIDIKQLLQGCIAGNRSYQKMLYERFSAEMFGVCKSYAHDHDGAKDILQESFIKVFKNIKKFSGEGSLRAWIRRIVINTAIDHYRKNKRQEPLYEITDYNVESESNKGYSELQTQELLRLVQNLPDGYRMVFNLYVLEGYNHKEIAEELNISIGTSKSQLSRAKDMLKAQIEELHKIKIAI